MTKTITNFLKGLKTAQLVQVYNLAQDPEKWKGTGKPGKPVTKFADRATAEKRLNKVMIGWDDAQNSFTGYNEFYGDFAQEAQKLGIELPTPEVDEPAPAAADPKPAKKKTATEGDTKKQKTPPHLNLRCGHEGCGYYAKTTPAWLAKGRLMCPMGKHGQLLTAEERGEKRGR